MLCGVAYVCITIFIEILFLCINLVLRCASFKDFVYIQGNEGIKPRVLFYVIKNPFCNVIVSSARFCVVRVS